MITIKTAKKQKLKENKGITLIALVITIIVLLILAGVTILTISSDNSIIKKSQESQEDMKEAEYEERIRLAVREKNITNYTNSPQTLYDVLSTTEGINGVQKSEDENIVYVEYKPKNQIWTVYTSEVIIKEKVDVWDGTVDSNGFIGEGTEENPYQINSAEQLAYLAQKVNEGTRYDGTYFSLNISVDLNNLSWVPIGGNIQNSTSVDDVASNMIFNGIFDGKSHSVYSLNAKYEEAEAIGLFGALGQDGRISDLSIKSGDIEGRLLVGGICGVNYGMIRNCNNLANVTAKSLNGESKNGNFSGGITGHNETTGNIINCSNSGNITSTNGNDSWNGGWAAGIAGISKGNISDCKNSGEIYAKHYRAGGIVGTFSIGTIKNCTNSGKIYSGWRGAGGIVGLCCDGGKIYNCSNTGYVSANTDEAGGIAGDVDGDINNNSSYSLIRDCINNGTVQANQKYFGGIAGSINSTGDILENCTNNGKVYALNEGTVFQYRIGGIAGGGAGIIRECINNGEIIAYGQVVGGIAGSHYGVIEKCTNTGKIILYKDVNNNNNAGLYTAGIVGILKKTDGLDNKILECKNEGEVIGETYTGGIARSCRFY